MNKMTHTKFNLNNFLMALSKPLDKKIHLSQKTYNSKRVSYIALKIALFNEVPQNTLSDMFSYIVLSRHEKANSNLSLIPFNNITQLEDKTIQNILKLSNFVENNIKIQNGFISNQHEIISLIENNHSLDEIIKENFFYLSQSSSFWLDILQEERLGYYIFNMLDDFTIEYSYKKLLEFGKVFHNIVYEYTNHTYFSNSIADKIHQACKYYNFDDKDTFRMILSGYLHNIGLLYIPQELFKKENPLTPLEYQIIQSAPYYTKYTLEQIFGFDDIANFAAATNELLDGSGFPYNLQGHELSLKHRLISILYYYQALSENRVYRKGFDKKSSFEILDKLAKKQKLDMTILNDIKSFI